VDIRTSSIQEAPYLGARVDFIRGLVIAAGRMLILLDVDELIPDDAELLPAADLAGVV
jgi:chemotaxis signal transduction protein